MYEPAFVVIQMFKTHKVSEECSSIRDEPLSKALKFSTHAIIFTVLSKVKNYAFMFCRIHLCRYVLICRRFLMLWCKYLYLAYLNDL